MQAEPKVAFHLSDFEFCGKTTNKIYSLTYSHLVHEQIFVHAFKSLFNSSSSSNSDKDGRQRRRKRKSLKNQEIRQLNKRKETKVKQVFSSGAKKYYHKRRHK